MIRNYLPIIMALSFMASLLSCQEKEEEPLFIKENQEPLFSKMKPSETGISFVNTVINQKDFNIFKYRNFYNGGGVAIGDINNDGLSDIYMTANMGPNKLYLNKGNFKFEDISEKAGIEGNKPWSTGVNLVDINSDGLLDIYVSNAGNLEGNNHDNDLYINNGDLTFTEKAEEFNLAKSGFSTHASFFDYDKDGDLDAYILNNSNIPVTSLGYAEQRDKRAQDWEDVPYIFRGVGDMLLRNDDGKFVDVSEETGIYGSLIGFGLGVMVTDINNDLYPDIYISNDFYERDYLYINNQNGTFTEAIKEWTSHLCLSAMGIDMADINNDGLNDIFITDMLPDGDQRVKSVMEFEGYNVYKLKQSKDFFQQYIQNTLQLNNGNGTFSEIAYFSGVSATDWSWSGLIFDMDNDGYRDIFVTNGVNHDLTDLDFVDFFANEIIQEMALTGKREAIDSIIDKMPVHPVPNYAYKNNKDLTFKNMAHDWGLGTPSLSNGAAYGDLDNDGDLDIVVNNVNMEAFVYKNNTSERLNQNFIKFKLKGGSTNRFAIGTKINLYFKNQVVLQELMPSRGFQSSVDYDLVVGLGDVEKIDSINIVWPNDKLTKLVSVKANQTLNLNQSEALSTYASNPRHPRKTLITELDNSSLRKHEENEYSDFDYEGLIYQLISQEGPAMAIGDIDNDGNDDIFVGGAKNQPAVLYMHSGNGKLRIRDIVAFADDAVFEDTAAAFIDVDNDGDQDLIVGSGGNEVWDKDNLKNRLYINDGKGYYAPSSIDLPSSNSNVSTISIEDFDSDGDDDIFIGSRNVVGVYGIDPEHLMLVNQGDGTFKNSTERIAYDLRKSGMITASIWKDIDNDNKKDLILISEWGTPQILKNSGRQLVKQSSSLDELTGWWNAIEVADLDNDGDLDLILGNQGYNLHYRPGRENPMKMWINDFDNNGTIEQIITQNINGKDYPIHQKKELVAQLASLKKQNLKASEYAKKTIHQLFSEDIINNAIVKEVKYSQSVIAINEGDLQFRIQDLPQRVQLSCICGISCIDVNNDGNLDLVMAGNNYEYKPQFSRLDAGFGTVLLGDGNLNFDWQDSETSGFTIKQEVKHLKVFKDKNDNQYIFSAINDEIPKVFSLDE